MTLLEDRLRDLGEALDVSDDGLVDEVMAQLDQPARSSVPSRLTGLRVAAAVLVAIAVGVAIVPSSRRAVADWFGFDGARIERRPDLEVPTTPDPLDRGAVGTIDEVEGTEVLVSTFDGTLDTPALGKTLGPGSDVTEVVVGDAFGLWIDGEPHEVGFRDADGHIVFEGFAGNTLLWQDGDLIRRLEGFADVETAIAYVESIGG